MGSYATSRAEQLNIAWADKTFYICCHPDCTRLGPSNGSQPLASSVQSSHPKSSSISSFNLPYFPL